jgi:hypothetical protein
MFLPANIGTGSARLKIALAALLILPMGLTISGYKRKARGIRVLTLAIAFGLLSFTTLSCGGDSSGGGGGGNTGTPAATYTVTVTGTNSGAPSAQHQMQLKLVVN